MVQHVQQNALVRNAVLTKISFSSLAVKEETSNLNEKYMLLIFASPLVRLAKQFAVNFFFQHVWINLRLGVSQLLIYFATHSTRSHYI